MKFSELLETERFLLNPITHDDIEEIFLLRSHPEVLKFLGRDPMKTKEEATTYINRSIKERKDEEAVDFAIRAKGGKKLMGKIGLWKFQKERNRAEIGYSLLPEHHRKGVMFECAQVILDYGFNDLGLHSICAEIDPFNEGSRRLLEKCKFRKEAHFTEDYFYKGKYTDSAIYSLLERWR